MDKKQILEQILEINKYFKFKITQKNENNYSPDKNNKKYLVIMACHCDFEIKLSAIKNNLKYFSFNNMDKIVINSTNLPYNKTVSDICSRYNNMKYYEIENSKLVDFGKWVHVLQNLIDYNSYDYIILTNDSYIIHNSINHFFNLMYKYNVDLFGYNDSSELKYHYQSYLFGLRKDVVPIFINKINSSIVKINCFWDVVLNYEINMCDWFSNNKTFLNIGNLASNKSKNVFFNNDQLYNPLKNTDLLPFTKIKRIKNN